MGIDETDIITVGDELLSRYPDAFTTDFNKNKTVVRNFTAIQSTRLRNRVAGYITRQKRTTENHGNNDGIESF